MQPVRAPRCVTDMDLRDNAGLGGVSSTECLGEFSGHAARFDQIDGAPAETASGEACADEAGQILGKCHHGVGFNATGFEVLAVADVGLGHQAAEFLAGRCWMSASAAATVRVFSVMTWRARLSGLGAHLRAPFFEVVYGWHRAGSGLRGDGGQ